MSWFNSQPSSAFSQKQVKDLLNTMPRKLHDWHSAHSVYAALSATSSQGWALLDSLRRLTRVATGRGVVPCGSVRSCRGR